ncbi:MAG: ABC transporter ATP-binding protein [Pseudomonadota bacterium]
MMLACKNLGWRARNKTIVSGVSLAAGQGEKLGLIGANGSGKSTLLHMLAGIRRPSEGTIELSGRDMARMSQREIAQHVALVEQNAETAERITVRNAIELGRTPWLSALRSWNSGDDLAVEAALSDVDLKGFENRQWHTLSGGERQRAHIARALCQEPQVLLLDEPTNHLDIRHQMTILDMVTKLPIAAIIALHDLNQAMLCDRICVLRAGQIIASGPPDEVVTENLLKDAFGVGARFLTDPHDQSKVIRFHINGSRKEN